MSEHEGCRRRKHFVENSKEVLLCNLGFISRKSRKSKPIWEELFRTSRRSTSPPSPSRCLSLSSLNSHTHAHTLSHGAAPLQSVSPPTHTHTHSHTNKHTVPRSCYPTANFRGSQTMSKTLFTTRVSAPSSISVQALTCPQLPSARGGSPAGKGVIRTQAGQMLQGREIRLEACVNVHCLLSAVQAQAHTPRSHAGALRRRGCGLPLSGPGGSLLTRVQGPTLCADAGGAPTGRPPSPAPASGHHTLRSGEPHGGGTAEPAAFHVNHLMETQK